ncbi:SDR family NAD(P)-dependent oxidoreductase [Tabrizicola sp.]|uniref:SDR family NAD(P)-dependent oxidoreductase n=1 Tax=Tabrizicola sp. TaxID=2005166 RepID=UPI003F31ECD8
MDWALVTGASEGLGREFADLAAAAGHPVILAARQAEKLEALAADLKAKHGVETLVIPVDLSDAAEAERLWTEASSGRRIGVLVNNAGLGRNGAFADAEGWGREWASLQVNAVALTVLMKRAVVAMVAQGGGRVLNVASTAGFVPGPQMAVYHATKAYVLSLTEAVADELRGTPVTVTALCPGATKTEFFKADEAESANWLTKMPLPTARSVAEAGWRAMLRGRVIHVPGINNKFSAFLPRILPRRMVARVTGMLLQRR